MDANLIIELGGGYITIYKKNAGLVLKEPSFVATKKVGESYKILAVGQDAQILESIQDENVTVFSPLSQGKIKSFPYAAHLLKTLFKKVDVSNFFLHPRAIVVVDTGFTYEDKQLYDKLFKEVGIKPKHYVPSVFGIMLFNEPAISESKIYGVIDIGASTTKVAIANKNEIFEGSCTSIGGRNMTLALKEFLKEKYALQTTFSQSQKLKENLANLTAFDNSNYEILGLDSHSKEVKKVVINAQEVKALLLPYFENIVQQIVFLLNQTSDELLKQIKINGLIVSGQVAKTVGLERFLKEKLFVPIKICDDAESSSVLGLESVLKNKQYLKQISYKIN